MEYKKGFNAALKANIFLVEFTTKIRFLGYSDII